MLIASWSAVAHAFCGAYLGSIQGPLVNRTSQVAIALSGQDTVLTLASDITTDMLLRAADAIAGVVTDEQLNASFIIPSVFNPDVPKAVAAAVRGDTVPPPSLGGSRVAR